LKPRRLHDAGISPAHFRQMQLELGARISFGAKEAALKLLSKPAHCISLDHGAS
jgi:hypothetical protein